MRITVTRCGSLCALVGLLVAAASGAQAQNNAPPNALQGFSQNRNQPVKIDSLSLDVRDKSKIATFSGNVHLVQGDTTLRCKVLVVHYDGEQSGGPAVKSGPAPSGNSQISHMEAIGGVVVTQRDQTATGEKAVYDMKADTVTLLAAPGSFVAVTQGHDIVRSDKSLIVHLASGVSHFDGRVEALITPNSANNTNNTSNTKSGTETRPGPDNKAPPRAAPKAHPTGLY